MWALIWVPRPRMKRPFEKACRSLPIWATVIGLRAKATAIDVIRPVLLVGPIHCQGSALYGDAAAMALCAANALS